LEHYGVLSILPPLIAIVLAIITKEVVSSLFIGIAVGALILTGFSPFEGFKLVVSTFMENVADPEWNTPIMFFCFLLGGVVGMMTKSGGARAFSTWFSRRITSRRGALISTWIFGLLVFIDDYFNSLTVGAVMRPITDRFRISRAKLAYILDSTASPVCILAPLSTWIAFVMSLMAKDFPEYGIDINPFMAFIYLIPYNFYAWLTIIMVLVISLTSLEYGPMAKFEKMAMETGKTYPEGGNVPPGEEFNTIEPNEKGGIIDLVVPVVVMLSATLLSMIYTGGYFDGGISLAEAFRQTDPAKALVWGMFTTLIITVVFYKIRGVASVSESINACIQGLKAMLIAVVILALAWTIGSITKQLGAGPYVATFVEKGFPEFLIPFLIFLVSCFMAFSTGSSWGTFGIMLPLAIPVAAASTSDILLPSMAAVLAGGVFGDHCSPLSDSTILSSAGANCDHIDHVNTQIPYAFTAAGVASIGFLLSGFISNSLIPLAICVVILLIVLKVFHNKWGGDVAVELPEDVLKQITKN